MLNTYQHIVHPITDEDIWHIPKDVKNIQVLPPKGRVKPGRLRKRRIKSASEPSTKNRCGRCGIYRHNRKTCINNPIQ